MKNIKLTLEYDGTNYSGWQIQRNPHRSIQEVLVDCILKVSGERVTVISSGRTDSGVHALGQVANFKTESKIEGPIWKKAINSYLPVDIKVLRSEEVGTTFHSRFDAKSRVYLYVILHQKTQSVFLKNYTYHIPFPLDLDRMKSASSAILGEHDFSSFRASSCSAKKPIRRIIDIIIVKEIMVKFPWVSYLKEGNIITITIEANAFLHHMVRNIIGTLIEIGKGRLSPENIEEILKARDRTKAGPTVPPQGLYLVMVKY